jgi:hypothetical protein
MDEEALQRRLLDMTVGSSGEGIQEIANKYRYNKVAYKKINLNKGTWRTDTLVPLNKNLFIFLLSLERSTLFSPSSSPRAIR